jgi:thiosulfate dehydrogenase [quinone] large subunit
MVNKWLRENVYASGMLLLLRLYVGYEWITAGLHKLTGGFSAAGFMKTAIDKPIADKATGELIYPTYTAFIKNFAFPNVDLFNIIVPIGEFCIGLGLILGCLTTVAMFFGLMMNFMFMFSGTVSTNPWLILLGSIIVVAGANAGKFGADYYVLPYIKKLTRKVIEPRTTSA